MAYVEVEKFDTWEWFLNLLLRDIGSQAERGWAFISDRQKELLEAVHKLAPGAEHRFCLRHMYNNFKVLFKGQELKRLFWRAASTYNVKQHLRVMREIERLCPKRDGVRTAFEWLSDVPAQHWARCFFPSKTRCDVIVNNITESFNSYILEARDKPIIEMFEWIRVRLMARIQIKREGMEKYQREVCPNILTKIEKQRQLARNFVPHYAGNEKYEVRQLHFLENHTVDLHYRICSCGMFQLVGYPCCHAIAACNHHRLDFENYVDDCLKKTTYLRVYSHMIHPVPGMHDFEVSTLGPIHPPQVKIRAGRPVKKGEEMAMIGTETQQGCQKRVSLTHVAYAIRLDIKRKDVPLEQEPET